MKIWIMKQSPRNACRVYVLYDASSQSEGILVKEYEALMIDRVHIVWKQLSGPEAEDGAREEKKTETKTKRLCPKHEYTLTQRCQEMKTNSRIWTIRRFPI